MSHYYYLGCALPPLSFEKEVEITLEELHVMLKMNLSEADLQKLSSLKLEEDLKNLKAIWLEKAIDPYGNYNEIELEEALLAKEDFPEFVIQFLDQYESNKERAKYFSSLMADFYRYAIDNFYGFLSEYFQFEKELRLTLTALRAKAFHQDLTKELQFEDLQDPFVAYLLAQKDAETLEVDSKYAQVKELFQKYLEEPKELAKALLQYRFYAIEEIKKRHFFAIDEILSYYIQLRMIESWQKLQSGDENLLNQIVRE